MKNWSSRIGGADPLVRGRRPRRPAGAPQDADVVVSAAGPGGPPHQAPRVWFFDSVGMGVPPAKLHENPMLWVGHASACQPAGGRPCRWFFAPVHPHSVVCLAHMAVKIFKW